MKNKIIGNAVLWASLMIASALLVGDSDNAPALLMLMIAGWYASQLVLTQAGDALRREWACIRRRLGK
ncbi:MAG: hypothetical protein QNJ40_04090 [Xanthomonadales bacterium]|nr:hypothetical protein [Xanthomonadales bacterium]